MKRIIFIMLLFMFAIDVKAASATLSVDINDVNVGDNLKINVSITDAATWNIHVNVDGIDDCSFSFVDVTNDAKNTNTTLNKKCKIEKSGTIKIALSGDITASEDEIPVSLQQVLIVNATIEKTDNPKTGLINIFPILSIAVATLLIVMYLFKNKIKIY